MTEAEKNEIVGLVMTEISSQAVDFDITTEQPQANDLLTAVRENESGGYRGVTIKWDDVARIATELANQAATRAEQALSDTTATKTEVGNMKASVEQTVTDFNALAEEKKQEVQGVYQNDLDELKGDLGELVAENNALKVEVARNRRQIENLNDRLDGDLIENKYKMTGEIPDEPGVLSLPPSKILPWAEIDEVHGKTLVWNQNHKKYGDFGSYSNNVTIKSIEEGVITFVSQEKNGNLNGASQYNIDGRLIYYSVDIKSTKGSSICSRIGYSRYNFGTDTTQWQKLEGLSNDGGAGIVAIYDTRESGWDDVQVRNPIMVDMTTIFGVTKVAQVTDWMKTWVRAYAEAHPQYDSGTLQSARNVKVRSDGELQSHWIVEIPSDWYTKASALGYDLGMEGTVIDFNEKKVTWTYREASFSTATVNIIAKEIDGSTLLVLLIASDATQIRIGNIISDSRSIVYYENYWYSPNGAYDYILTGFTDGAGRIGIWVDRTFSSLDEATTYVRSLKETMVYELATPITKTFAELGFVPIDNGLPIESNGTISVISEGAQAEAMIHYAIDNRSTT